MYEYRKLTPEQRAELVQQRLARGHPPHSPPHPIRDQPFYLLTAIGRQWLRDLWTHYPVRDYGREWDDF